MEHESFRYGSLDDIRAAMSKTGTKLPISEDLSVLAGPLQIKDIGLSNRLVLQPMEGCDGTADGSPDELTTRRYMRFAESGAGLIWFEATAIVHEGRANARQLMLTEKNLGEYKRLIERIKELSVKQNGFEPVIIMQATHSGRYSKPDGQPAPVIACNNPVYEKTPISADRIARDDYLDSLPEKYAVSARLAEAAGFDGVDIKACHRYLINELLSARTRTGSKYGGSFENRYRLYIDAIKAARQITSGSMIITSRLNVFDGIEFPYGFGTSEAHPEGIDLSEPNELVSKLYNELDIKLLNITIGNPYFNPHVNRPFDNGPYTAPEHPFEGLERMYNCIAEIKCKNPGMIIVASGLSYTRHFSPYIAAGLISAEQSALSYADLVGYGRESFAYPRFANDILTVGKMDSQKCCICCGKCSELMRAGSTAGCVIRDEVYREIYQEMK